ncbi:MAG: hypothetical protein OEN48_16910 [Betaproteobacteria bacterium]|nr:hypothetical protein [Betaproteobacteria bacterium]
MLGEPGTYDATVYDHLPGGGDEGAWFRLAFEHLEGLTIVTRRLPEGEPLPSPEEADTFVLGGSYNSVHDDFPWQRAVLRWLPELRAADKPLLAICGGHQLLCHFFRAPVVPLAAAPAAGTLDTALTEAGTSSALFAGLGPVSRFHFANYEHVPVVPHGAALLASADRVPVAALDFGRNWFSTQFHPEATIETMSASWARTHPELCRRYDAGDAGAKLVENFAGLAATVGAK